MGQEDPGLFTRIGQYDRTDGWGERCDVLDPLVLRRTIRTIRRTLVPQTGYPGHTLWVGGRCVRAFPTPATRHGLPYPNTSDWKTNLPLTDP